MEFPFTPTTPAKLPGRAIVGAWLAGLAFAWTVVAPDGLVRLLLDRFWRAECGEDWLAVGAMFFQSPVTVAALLAIPLAWAGNRRMRFGALAGGAIQLAYWCLLVLTTRCESVFSRRR